MLDINTERLTSTVSQLENVNREIDEAMSILSQITEHNNWNCAERNTINSQIRSHREKIKIIHERMDNFTTVSKDVAEKFVQKEQQISKMFESLDALLNGLLSIGGTSAVIMSGALPPTIGGGGGGSVDRFGNDTIGQKVKAMIEKLKNQWTFIPITKLNISRLLNRGKGHVPMDNLKPGSGGELKLDPIVTAVKPIGLVDLKNLQL